MTTESHASDVRAWLLDRQVAGGFVVLLTSVITMVIIRPEFVGIPNTLALFGFNQMQATYFPGISGAFFVALFLVYLYVLAVLGAGLNRLATSAKD